MAMMFTKDFQKRVGYNNMLLPKMFADPEGDYLTFVVITDIPKDLRITLIMKH
jgi:hypothetical protein